MPLSTQLSESVRQQLVMFRSGKYDSPEAVAVRPILDLQSEWSVIPKETELLIERTYTREGEHLFIYPFEGRLVHEGLAALFAFRIARKKPVTISLSVNDYGIELLSDQKLPIQDAISNGLPLAFPLMVNRLRAKISSEKLADRIQKMQKALEKAANQKSTGKRVRCRVLANSET